MRETLNASACEALVEDVAWSDPSLLASLSVLAAINVMVIVGNCLVIAAVFCSSKLRSVTNLFIVSLAVADLLVGVAVLPFSATWEIYKVWIFGDVWCSMWLALDVWMCTASILNLCVISLDRYVAVTRPITYPSIMSPSRAKMLIAGLWVLSFVICFPPLVGWKDDTPVRVRGISNGLKDKVWIFGDVWCSMWLALDVWMCTASILNLCVISLDRYVAVTRPITYPSIMSPSRAKMLIAGLWVLSFVICFPPLVGLKDDTPVRVRGISNGLKDKVWIFGDVWCSMWLALDVWMCTASILNLCVISLDRYVAVTRPITYPSIMSPSRAKMLIAGLWVLSFVICFPPLVGLKDDTPVWIFGDVWCSMWLALDVWMCTASILNLCVISLDRYVAVTRPITYPSIMSPSRAKMLIAGLWVLSFVICFPPLVGLKDDTPVRVRGISNGLKDKVWIFGDVWCSMWLALDVWMCTASILNLCVISLDRYVAVTRPITYPSIMSPSRAKMLIAGLWVLSFVICFPPLVGWKDDTPIEQDPDSNATEVSRAPVPNPPCPWKCELTNEAGYVVYSALGSFYIPMFVMLFFYWRIYKAAVRTTRAINQGFRTTKGSRGIGNRFDEQRLTLRIHRGRGSVMSHGHGAHGSPHSNGSNSTLTTTGSASPSASTRSARHERVKISVSYPSSENLTPHHLAPSPTAAYAVHYTASNGKEQTSTALCRSPHGERGAGDTHLRVHHHGRITGRRSRRSSSCDSHHERDRSPAPSHSGSAFSGFDETTGGVHKPKVISRRMGKRNIKAQVKRFRMETKAAKTLGIIVGGFIFCWLPFFTMYLIRAFCEECIPPLLFSILFWLGYCNSAINPLIYALFSKDFRFAFKRIICRCFCKGGGTTTPSRRGSDGSQLQGRQFRSPSYNMHQPGNSLDGDSDPEQGVEASDSR